jgi:hypothetical protein
MKNYVQLVNFEFNRVAKLFTVLLGITLVSQIVAVIVESNKYLDMANERIYEQLMPKEQFLMEFGQFSFAQVVRSIWFLGPIALCVAGVGFYIFLIWYRDWVGKNTFIYRLLMLPTTRLNIFLAKITTILLMALGLVAFQLILFPIETMILKSIVQEELLMDLSMIETLRILPELSLVIPGSFLELVLFYGVGLMLVSILFTAILLERSFKWKGIFAGIVYSGVAVVVFLSPILLQDLVLNGYFYPIEVFLLEIVLGLIVLTASTWISGYLLKKKITV